ncbi:MAG TPA: PH domain-containing protein [Polyangia bacterium]
MPLVPCPTCNRAISDAAPACPHCGHPMAMATAAGKAHATRGIAGAPGPEQTLWEGTPSLKALLGVIILTALYVLVLPALIHFGYPLLRGLLSGLHDSVKRVLTSQNDTIVFVLWLAVGALIVARTAVLLWRLAVLKTNRYRVTNQRIVVETGVFSKHIEEVDMRLVEDFKLQQSLIERLLKIGDIVVVSSDRTAAALTLRGLPDPRELRELIRSSAYQATRGQLFTRDV